MFYFSISLALSNRPNPPPLRKTSLPKHSDVKKKFLEMCQNTLSDDVKVALRLPSFDSYDYEDYEILHLMEMMFTELDFVEVRKFAVLLRCRLSLTYRLGLNRSSTCLRFT